jgi:polyisoprenoid-binding protein YceI
VKVIKQINFKRKTNFMRYNPSSFFLKSILSLSVLFFISANAQTNYSAKNNVSLLISGTSTLHNWDMKSNNGDCQANFTLNAAGAVTAASSVNFYTNVLELKSGKGAMDKNAYKVLKTEKTPLVNFQSTNVAVSNVGGNFLVKATGKLTIAGTTKDAVVEATCKVNADKSIAVNGTKKVSMKDFAMEPPSFMMGAIKTGNEVTLKFDFKLTSIN